MSCQLSSFRIRKKIDRVTTIPKSFYHNTKQEALRARERAREGAEYDDASAKIDDGFRIK